MKPAIIKAITADHVTYVTEMLPTESDVSRLWIIEKQKPKNAADFYNSTVLSYQWFYYTHYGCEYNASIQRKIESLNV
jgi:hypothetical protein